MSERVQLSRSVVPDELLSRPLLFDTNIWLFVNGPFVDLMDQRHKIYSNLYGLALKSNTTIYLPQIVVTEFVGRSLRFCVESEHSGEPPRKPHKWPEYSQWINDISDDLFHIVDACERVGDGFADLDLDAVCKAATAVAADYNDIIISQICAKNDAILVTDDADYKDIDIPVASANRKFFSP